MRKGQERGTVMTFHRYSGLRSSQFSKEMVEFDLNYYTTRNAAESLLLENS